MLAAQTAIDITVVSVRSVGNLYPIEKNPIEMQMPLEDLRIKIAQQVEELKVRILQNLMKLKPPHILNKEHLRNVDTSTKVGDLAALVRKAEPVHQWLGTQ